MRNSSGIILIIVSIGLFFTVIDPIYKEVQSLQQVRRENEDMIRRAAELRRIREDLMTNYNNISPAQRDLLNRVLPETVDNIRLIANINNIADNNGISLTNFSLSGDIVQETDSRVVDRTGRNYGIIQLSFAFNSDYQIMKNFLKELEDSLRLVDIRELSVGAGSGSDVYSFSLQLDTYWLR